MGKQATPSITLGLLEQAKNRLRQLLGLGQDRGTSLLQDLVLAQVGGCGGKVGVLDTTACCRNVLGDTLQVSNGVVEAVLHSTQIRTLRVDKSNCRINDIDSVLCTKGSTHINITNFC